ncbi:hypothetical protein KZX45_09685 [Georgenia sp. EYE_87]|nr:hypothetical protein [Georgenia sp. EYE_87]
MLRSAYVRQNRPVVTVYGNCQASALRTLLQRSPSFSNKFTIAWIPGAHQITAHQLPTIRKILRKTSIFITQEIKNDYRGLPLGTSQFVSALASGAQVVTYPVMYYRGLHPYLVYVHANGALGTPAPRTEGYHDLRFIAAAARRMRPAEASRWLEDYTGNAEWIRAVASESLNELKRREERLDIKVSHAIAPLRDTAFWTVNHPSNDLMDVAVQGIMDALSLDSDVLAPLDYELLSSTVVPVHNHIRHALGYTTTSTESLWTIANTLTLEKRLLESHLEYYTARGEILEHALREHGEVLHRAGLL